MNGLKETKDHINSLASEVDHLQRTIIRLSNIHEAKYRHMCYDWDGLEIDEFDPEFNSCTCFDEINELKRHER